MTKNMEFTLNGDRVTVQVDPSWTLLYVLREKLDHTGTKEGCGYGECGACTVILDGKAVNSCLLPVLEAEGRKVTTIEGLLSKNGALHPIQQAFVDHGAVQCGYCTPGMIMAALDIVRRRGNDLDEHTIREQLDGNICRCTGYHNIVSSIEDAAKRMGGAS
jgi:carbon-monoxide dehydrogenase small subunit